MPRRCWMLLLVILSLMVVFPAHAQQSTPQNAATEVRQWLFDAQAALMNGDPVQAVTLVEEARDLYAESLYPSIFEVDTETAALLDAAFDSALAAGQSGDVLVLAVQRGQIWTGLLRGSTNVVLGALESGDGETAWMWLPLREYRLSTRFSRPGADATLAVQGLLAGSVESGAALESVTADLLDTYQAQFILALADADEAHGRGFAMRQAEEAGLAAGYFEILAPAYLLQRGDEALFTAREAFAALVQASLTDGSTAYEQARLNIDAALKGFRAAPLSESEQARRAGQLLRFIALVPVEYERGVRDGVVVKDIEIQEAVTFREGAAAAFADLTLTLEPIDPDATARIGLLLDEVDTQIRAVAAPAEVEATVNEINTLLADLLPESWQASNSDADIDVILSVLDRLESAVEAGQYPLAESARLEAYALLELGIEQRLRGFAPEMAVYIESLFWQGTPERGGLSVLLATEAPLVQVRATLSELKTAFGEAHTLLNAAKAAPAAVAGNAAVIVFREGLEAVLILASLLASLRAAEEKRFRRPLLMGAGLAFAATAVTWWIANQVLTLLLPLGERLEAIVSLIAIGVLLLITNWFFHKVYWTGWMANFHTKKRQLIGGVAVITISQSLGLVILGFASIYREGFETVLFLQSLVLEAGMGIVLQGVVLGLLATLLVGMVTFWLQVRLPYKRMLVVTGVMIGFVLLTMVGNTVHVMQSVGWLPITPIPGLYLPYWMGQWFGLFATWQGIGLQVAAAAFVLGSYFWAERIQQRKRQTRSAKTSGDAVLERAS